jgi:hypothetical protein
LGPAAASDDGMGVGGVETEHLHGGDFDLI